MNSQPSPNYTQTTFGQITKKLVNGGTPPTEIAHFWNGKIPWITGADFTTNGIGEFRRFVSETAIAQTATNLIDQGQLLLVTRTGVGKLAIAPCDIAISQDITGVYPDTEKVDVRFLYHRMRLGVEDLKKLNQGTSINGIIRSDLFAYPIQLPALPQQRHIVEILSTLDDAIEESEALIAKHQQIKAGLMHDLFTRGVTPDGHLRPIREQAPGLYKESSLGWIPKEWDCRPCSQICERITVGIVIRPTQYYVEHGVPAFRSANVREAGIDASDFVFISKEANDLLAKSQVRAGDILTVRTGYPGTSAVVPNEFSGANAIDILLSRPTLEVNSFFLCYWINSSFGKGHVLKTQGGLAQQHFNVGELRDLPVALPKLDEQRAITERLDSLSQHIRDEELALVKWVKMKHGLMHDLLTGRVRVPMTEQ